MKDTKDLKDQWNASLYDLKHSFVSKFGNDLVDLLAPKKGEKILDLGCGTGDLANKLSELEVIVLGIDKSENMVHQAQKKYPKLSFMVSDAINLDFEEEFDAVFSNATLHWVKPPNKALDGIYRSLKHGGRFVAEFGGKGNVQTITDEITHQLKNYQQTPQFPWYYPSIGEYTTLMEQAGFRVTFAHHYDRPTPLEGDNGLRNWIEMFALGMFEGISENIKEQVLSKVENNLKPLLIKDGIWMADYKRIRVIGIKE
nr:class I SAM-dependent methyltransferase [Neobacillus sp. Marseille-Q6967]